MKQQKQNPLPVSAEPIHKQRKHFNSVAKEYDSLVRIKQYDIDFDVMDKYLDCKKKRKILDLATGTGKIALGMLSRFKNSQVWGIDISQEMLDIASNKYQELGCQERLKLVKGDILNLPFSDKTFDLAVAGYAFHHVQKYNRLDFLCETKRVLKDNGAIVILEVGKAHFIEAIELHVGKSDILANRFDIQEIEELIRSADLSVICSIVRREYQKLRIEYIARYLKHQGLIHISTRKFTCVLKDKFGELAPITSERLICIAHK